MPGMWCPDGITGSKPLHDVLVLVEVHLGLVREPTILASSRRRVWAMSATQRNLESIARSLAAGFSFGPRRTCACCHAKIADADSVGRGLCRACWIEIAKVRKA